jgi:hypothetical protein
MASFLNDSPPSPLWLWMLAIVLTTMLLIRAEAFNIFPK